MYVKQLRVYNVNGFTLLTIYVKKQTERGPIPMSINSFDNYYMSWKPQLNRTNQPLYISLARQLENDIATGVLLPGTKLPPQRELADFLDINVSTVVRAFKLCSNKGLLTSTVGSGTYVAYDVVTNIFDTPAKKSLI